MSVHRQHNALDQVVGNRVLVALVYGIETEDGPCIDHVLALALGLMIIIMTFLAVELRLRLILTQGFPVALGNALALGRLHNNQKALYLANIFPDRQDVTREIAAGSDMKRLAPVHLLVRGHAVAHLHVRPGQEARQPDTEETAQC